MVEQASKSPVPASVIAAAPRPIALGRGAMLACLAIGGLVAAWAGAATWYILSRDELAQRYFAVETEMKFAYEDRIAALSQRLERELTLGLVERRGFEARTDGIAKRQAEIEARQNWLRSVAERVGGKVSEGKVAPTTSAATQPAKPVPLGGEDGFKLRDGPDVGANSPRDRLSSIENSLEHISSEGAGLLKALGQSTRVRVTRLRSALDATGFGSDRGQVAGGDAVGGPLVPLGEGARTGAFAFLAEDLEMSFAELARLNAAVRSLPLRMPVPGQLEQTSGFGHRLDPFTRSPALHTGVDFRAETGTPALATGAGRVVSAEYSGGYGLMVEIDHGGGLTTRYGHLSALSVVPGERVEAGQSIGRTGSTGRSTGAHLHYETRINGEAVNPNRFLALARLAAEHGG